MEISIKKERQRGRINCRGKKWWLLGDTREPPKNHPGIFHSELKELAGIWEAKEVKTAEQSKNSTSSHANNLQASLHAYNMYPYGVLG